MAILTVQFGQCGNQVGHSLFTYLVNDIIYEPENKKILPANNLEYRLLATNNWFSENKPGSNIFVPRSVLVDTENKVISSITKDKSLLKYKNVIAKSDGGSANNWAYGYYEKTENIKDEVLCLIRREIEKCDEIVHIFTILSSGGGTGSGVGSSIIEKIRDEFENKTILNTTILPYNEGEVVTQNYNTLLTLAKIYDITDGNILFENAQLHTICTDLLAIQEVKLTHINSVISQKMAALLQPAQELSISNITELISHPNYKLIKIKTVPHISKEYVKFETAQSWSNLVSRVRNVLRLHSQSEAKSLSSARSYPNAQFYKSVGSLLISRGGLPPESTDITGLNDNDLYARWLPKESRLRHFHSIRNLFNTSNFLALATNNSSICNTLNSIVEDSWNLYNHKAFLHQYEQYGIAKDEFEEAFVKLESVIQSYKTI